MPSVTSTAAADASPQPKQRPSDVRLLVLAVVLMALLAVPVVGLLLSPLAPGAGSAMPGIMLAALSMLNLGIRRGLLLTAAAVVAVGLSPIGVLYPAIGVMILLVAGGLTGVAAFRGYATPVIQTALFIGLTMVDPPTLTAAQVSRGVTVTPSYLVTLIGIEALGAAWAALIVIVLRKKLPTIPRVPLQPEASIVYGITLGLLIAAVGAVSLTWFPYTLAGWTILTICVIARPMYPGEGVVSGLRHKAEHRAAGTLGGVIIAAALATVIHSANALVILALVFLVGAMERLAAGAPYWQFVILLTPAMVFMGQGGTHIERVGLLRLGCSLLGIVLSVIALEFNRKFTFPWIGRVRQAEASSVASG